MWETFAAQFAANAGKGVGEALGGGGGPITSGNDLRGANWSLGSGEWSAPITITTASPGASVTAAPAAWQTFAIVGVLLVGAAWIALRR